MIIKLKILHIRYLEVVLSLTSVMIENSRE